MTEAIGAQRQTLSSPLSAAEVGEISSNLLGTCGVEPAVSSPVDLPRLTVDIVLKDRNPFSSTAASFKESMRRDAMTGAKIVFALWDTSQC